MSAGAGAGAGAGACCGRGHGYSCANPPPMNATVSPVIVLFHDGDTAATEKTVAEREIEGMKLSMWLKLLPKYCEKHDIN